MTIKMAIVGCCKDKLEGRHRARELYTSPLFRAHLRLAEALGPERVYVASAKHGLVGIDDELDSYELELSDLDRGEIGAWRRQVGAAVDTLATGRELVVLLAGSMYASWTDGCHRRVVQPLAGMMVGERLSFVARTVGS